jgi:hypothetical protein
MSDEEDRDLDKKKAYFTESKVTTLVSLDQIKSLYIASSMEPEQIAEETRIPIETIKDIIDEHKLPELRKAYIREGVAKLQNQQLHQAQKLMDLELNFKKMRITQLEEELKNFMAYYGRHGDFYKRHPVTGDILKDSNGIPLQLHIPNVSREISQLKESVTLSEGMKNLLGQLDDILNSRKGEEAVGNEDDIIDVTNLDGFFKKN